MNLQEITSQVSELARQTGEFVRKAAAEFSRDSIEYKGLNDMVSYVDKESEIRLVEGLKKILPEAGFIAEEGTGEKTDNQEFAWIIDPVDGTTNYMHGVPVFAISIALQQNDKIILGVVYEINRDECFAAWLGGGAYLNESPIKVSSAKHLKDSLIATGFPYYDFELMDNYINILKELMQKSHGLRRFGAAAVDLAYTACGRFEGFFEYNLKPWDVAAGTLIVQEAGGFVRDFKGGNDFVFGRELIAGCEMFSELEEVITRNWKM
ncbi:myo-inositol-1(or 4)-monophosphatase [Arcicella aurantiaca]|uniref:Inositol-1-monophosphatase n=1 Tax=Arcicella aurantiaca TaxID=591202 RepID=A0A316EIP4_9BACT|nr:inositol monophosphatase family protein [Arcicella aurantiaca]PWK29428.1 myo-inositol-1(or 4)-monophosphatase [Arcicella aurantiaca]